MDDSPAFEKRRFTRYPYTKAVGYKELRFSENKISTSNLIEAQLKDLSASGAEFMTKAPPPLSSIIHLDFDFTRTRAWRDHNKTRILLLNRRPIGRVVHVEEMRNGEYAVGVAFVKTTEGTVSILEGSKKARRFKLATIYLGDVLAVLLVIGLVLSLNFNAFVKRKVYLPTEEMKLNPKSVGMNFENIYFKTPDHETLNGWFVPSRNSKLAILYCHGNDGNMSDELSRLNFFHKMGLNVFIFDYRGYGKSTGKQSETGVYRDAQAAYDYLISRKDIQNANIVAWGESLGGAVAADLSLHRQLRAIVLESTFVSLVLEAQDLYPFLPVRLLLSEKFDTLSKIKRIKIPKLIVHGTNDEVVSFKHARQLYDIAPEPKEFIAFEGGHSDDIFKISEDYRKKLNKFFSDHQILEKG